VNVGDEIAGESRRLGWTDIALQTSGSQDWNLVHHDPDFARDSGHDTTFFNTGWTAATLSRLVTDWAGPAGWLSRLEVRMGRMNCPGDTIVARGRIAGVAPPDSDGTRVVTLDVWIENDRQGTTTTGNAVVRLAAS
jgi:acyl dehydratase